MCHHRPRPRIGARVPRLVPHFDAGRAAVDAVRIDVEGGDDYEIGDDGGCFAAALEAVRHFGGVLEHPASSLAWKAHELTRPRRGAWSFSTDSWAGRVTEVDQGRYGHRARKRTWLYVVSTALMLPLLEWDEAVSDVCVSGFLHRTGTDETRRVRPREASATPPAFRDMLLALARSSGPTLHPTTVLHGAWIKSAP